MFSCCDKVDDGLLGLLRLGLIFEDDVDEYYDDDYEDDDEEEVPRQGTKATNGLCLYVLAELNFLPP